MVKVEPSTHSVDARAVSWDRERLSAVPKHLGHRLVSSATLLGVKPVHESACSATTRDAEEEAQAP